jgi:hypothetical protein
MGKVCLIPNEVVETIFVVGLSHQTGRVANHYDLGWVLVQSRRRLQGGEAKTLVLAQE